MDKKYERGVHLIGRIGLIIGVVFMLGIPAVISAVYHVWPTSITQVMTIGGGLLLMFIPTALAEVISYTPVLGSSAYITFLTGNVMNLKLPCVINSHTLDVYKRQSPTGARAPVWRAWWCLRTAGRKRAVTAASRSKA